MSTNPDLLAAALPDRIAKARAYLWALSHIRLFPVFVKTSATDMGGMGHLSASRQSIDNLLLLGFRGTIEVVYTNNGYNEDAFRDMFPAFAQGGEFTGPGGERARIEYIPMYSVPSSNVIGMRRVREEEDPFHRHEKNTDRYPRRAVQLINNWDKGAFDQRRIEEILQDTRDFAPSLDLDPANARYIVNLQAFGWGEMGRRFVFDNDSNTGYDIGVPHDGIVGYLRAPYPNPIGEAARHGRERLREAIRALMRKNPVLKANASLQVLVCGLSSRTLAVECRLGTTVAQLKRLIWNQTAIPPNAQFLTHNAKPLADAKTLYESGVVHGDIVRGNVRGGTLPLDPGDTDSELVTGAPQGKLLDANTIATLSAILEASALGLCDLLPGYGFHNSGRHSLDTIALAARKALTELEPRRPVVFLSLRHTLVPSATLLNDERPRLQYMKADDPETPSRLADLRAGQVAIVAAGAIPGAIFNQLALSATLPIALEGAGTASFAIEQGIPYIPLANNASIVDARIEPNISHTLREIADCLSARDPASEAQIEQLAKLMVASRNEHSPAARYFRGLQAEIHKPERHQMAAAFERLYDLTPSTVSVSRAQNQASPAASGETINFTVVFSKAPYDFTADTLALTGTGTVNLTQAVKTITLLPAAPAGASSPAAVAYNVAVSGITGIGSVTAQIGSGTVTDLGQHNFLVTAAVDSSNTVTLQ